jgi:hypothetical protein
LTCFFSRQSVHKFGKKAYVEYPEVVDIIGVLDNHELGLTRFTNIRHFKFSLDKQENDDSVKMRWKPSSESSEWEGGFSYFETDAAGNRKNVEFENLRKVPVCSTRMMVWPVAMSSSLLYMMFGLQVKSDSKSNGGEVKVTSLAKSRESLIGILGIAEPFKSAIPEWNQLFDYLESLPKNAHESMGVVGEKNGGLLKKIVCLTDMRPERVAKVETMLIPMWLNGVVPNSCPKCGLMDVNETE